MALTLEQIEAAKTPSGGWTRWQLAAWGISWPPPKGWKQQLVNDGQTFEQIGSAGRTVVAQIALALRLAAFTESPIETILGVALTRAMDGLAAELIPQYKWRRYRIDWALRWEHHELPCICVECDGKDFHTTADQIAHDARRDAEMLAAGWTVLRFTGSEINQNPDQCAHLIVLEFERWR